MSNRIRAGRVPINLQAFSHDLAVKRKRPRVEKAAHLAFIRALPCLVCGTRKGGIEAAHLRAGNFLYGKRATGMGEKPSDCWTLPLCREHHAEQHQGSELSFWATHRIDPFVVALTLFACTGDEATGESVVRQYVR